MSVVDRVVVCVVADVEVLPLLPRAVPHNAPRNVEHVGASIRDGRPQRVPLLGRGLAQGIPVLVGVVLSRA